MIKSTLFMKIMIIVSPSLFKIKCIYLTQTPTCAGIICVQFVSPRTIAVERLLQTNLNSSGQGQGMSRNRGSLRIRVNGRAAGEGVGLR